MLESFELLSKEAKVKKDIISKDILKHIARDIARHILHLEIHEDMELIDKEFTRIEKRDADLIFKNGSEIVVKRDRIL